MHNCGKAVNKLLNGYQRMTMASFIVCQKEHGSYSCLIYCIVLTCKFEPQSFS